jgi:hypothetical protein
MATVKGQRDGLKYCVITVDIITNACLKITVKITVQGKDN